MSATITATQTDVEDVAPPIGATIVVLAIGVHARGNALLHDITFPPGPVRRGVVPVGEMTPAGRAISAALANRWGFESLGRSFGVDRRFGADPGVDRYLAAVAGSPVAGWVVLVGLSVAGVVGTLVVLARRTVAYRPPPSVRTTVRSVDSAG